MKVTKTFSSDKNVVKEEVLLIFLVLFLFGKLYMLMFAL